jgi:hypothetical protein
VTILILFSDLLENCPKFWQILGVLFFWPFLAIFEVFEVFEVFGQKPKKLIFCQKVSF